MKNCRGTKSATFKNYGIRSKNFIINENDFQAYKQFGNAVNVNCVEFLASQLFIQTK